MLKQISSVVIPKQKVRFLASSSAAFHRSHSSGNNSIASKDSSVNIPTEADVVVIGGGSLGCNVLYHLSKLGISNAVLLERNQLTSGTTWHSAGLVTQISGTCDTFYELTSYARQLFQSLEEETGVSTGWIENGSLGTASNKNRLEYFKRAKAFNSGLGLESYILSPEETKKLYPLMEVADLHGSFYTPSDGIIDPTGVCTALIRGAKRLGAKVIENCPVTHVRTKESWMGSKQITEVQTPYGSINTPAVINCTGGWSSDIGEMVGCSNLVQVIKHSLVVTEHIEGTQGMPTVRDFESSAYIRASGGYLCVGGFELNPPLVNDPLPQDFTFGLYDFDWDAFGSLFNGAMHRIPALVETGIKSSVCGPESFTADHRPIMGEDPHIRGFYHCYGFNSSGMALGPGCGREIARWVVHGRPILNMFAYDVRRLHPELSSNKRWVKEKSHEGFSKRYSIPYQNDEPLAARNQFKDPLHQILSEQGCVYQVRHGWERPAWFSDGIVPVLDYDYYGAYQDSPPRTSYAYYDRLKDDYTFDYESQYDVIKDECIACRTKAVIYNISSFGKLYITGPDAQKAADWIFTNRMDKKEGSTVYTCMVNERGGTEADLTVSIVGSGDGSPCDPSFEGIGFYLATGTDATHQNLAHIMSAVRKEKLNVNITNYSDKMGILSIQGPLSRSVLQPLVDTDLSDGAFPYSTHKVVRLRGHKLRMMRISYVGEMGWELHVPFDSMLDVYKEIMKQEKPQRPINSGFRALDCLSVEKGYRHWHGDVRSDDTPLEAGLGFTCKLKSDTEFLGRSALEKQKKEGMKKRLACFTTDVGTALLGMETIWRDGERVGFTRRAGHGFALNKEVSYGYISNKNNDKVTLDWMKSGKYQIEVRGQLVDAVFHPKTPFDPQNNRLKGIYEH